MATVATAVAGGKGVEKINVAAESMPEFLHNDLESLKEITVSDKERYKEALGKSPQRTWVNYFPFLLAFNATPSRSILLGEENGSLCTYLLIHWPRKIRLHLYFPPMPMNQQALDRCFVRINAFNGDNDGRLWWVSGALKDEVARSGNFRLKRVDEEFIYAPVMLQDLNDSKFRVLRYQLRRAERENRIDVRQFSAADKTDCLQLLDKWYRVKTASSILETSYFYSKACIQLFEQFSPDDLYGCVYAIGGKIRAFAFGGGLVGETGCSFLNISDHDYPSLGYFARYHFFKNMQRYTTINDGGAGSVSGLMHVKNNLAPFRIEGIYKARQKRPHGVMIQVSREAQAETKGMENCESEILKGLKAVSIADQEFFFRCIGKEKKKSWISFFPILYSFGHRKQRALYWELYRGSICLYYLSEKPSGKRLSLYMRPFPFRSSTLAYAMDRVNRFNRDNNGEITWVEESERKYFARLEYDISPVEEEYIYAKESLDAFLKTCTVSGNVTTRPYIGEDEEACLDLLERRRADYLQKGGKNAKFFLKRSCIRNALKYIDGTILGEVLLVDGNMQGVCFAGAVNSEYVSFFVTLTAPEYGELKFFQQASMARNFSIPLFNNSAEKDGEPAPYLSESIKPVAMHRMFRARQSVRTGAKKLAREVKDINAALFIKAARELALNVDIVSAAYSYCVISNGRKTLHVYHNATSITDVATRKATHNKYISQNILKNNGIPIPESKIFNPEDLDKIIGHVARHRPVVIKPVKGSRSVGVTVDPRSEEEVRQAVALIKGDKVMIEQLIRGQDYRILIYKGRIIDVLRWLPPYVVGNGLDTLHGLIDEKNQYYQRNGLPTIQVDLEYLGHQGLDMGCVPKRGLQVSLHHSNEHYVGGETVKVGLQTIHPDNMAMFARVVEVSGLALAGLDFISEDPGVPYSENGAGINEINSAPHIWPHYFAEQKEDLSAVKAILDGFFSEHHD